MSDLVQGVDFICLPTRDFAKAKEFYEDVLGLEASIQWGDRPAGEFETGNLTIALMQTDAFGLEFAPHSVPVSFRVDDVATRRAELEAKGVEFQGEILDSGVCHQSFFRDPDGNAYEIAKRRQAPAADRTRPVVISRTGNRVKDSSRRAAWS